MKEIIALTRHLSVDLSPPILYDEGLTHALRWLSAQMEEQYGLHVDLQAAEPAPPSSSSVSFGLPTLRRRMTLFGGQMDVQSAPGKGTHVTVTLPVFAPLVRA
jgi:signal transduction histidine kinase